MPPTPKRYIALLSQSGTNAPIAIELENTVGAVVWHYVGPGIYDLDRVGAFPVNRTVVGQPSLTNNDEPFSHLDLICHSPDRVRFYSRSDGGSSETVFVNGFNYAPIEIVVYPE